MEIKHIQYPSLPFLEHLFCLPKFFRRSQNRRVAYFNVQELLITLGAANFNGDCQNKARELVRQGLDWDNFCQIAIVSGKANAIIRHLGELNNFIAIPQAVLERLENARLIILAGTARYQKTLLDILKSFSGAGIEVIPLKGTLLSQRLYGDISMRGVSVDIDLLIKGQDRPQAQELLERLGFKQSQMREIAVWRWQNDFFKKDVAVIDLHWDITMMARNRQRIEGLWQDAKKVNVRTERGAMSYYQWPDETLLLYLCVTLVNSKGYRDLKYFFDIRRLLEAAKQLDWRNVVDKAYNYKVNNSLYAGLINAKELLDAEVPEAVLVRLRPCLLKRLLIRLFLAKSVIRGENIRRRIMDRFLSYIFFEALEAATLKDYLKIVQRVFFPPWETFSMDRKTSGQYFISALKRLWGGFNTIGRIILREKHP